MRVTRLFKAVPCTLAHAAAVLLVWTWPMLAQADCVDGVRKSSASESDFHKRATAALIAALPPVPQGVRVTGVVADIKRLPDIGVMCKDQKSGDFNISASRFYVLDLSEEESNRRRALADALDKPRLQALVGKSPPGVEESESFVLKAQPVSVVQSTQATPVATVNATSANGEPGAAAVVVSTPAVKPPAPPVAVEPIKNAAAAVNAIRGLFGR